MGIIRASMSVSLDGFSAGANSSPQFPLGNGGERLHAWMSSAPAADGRQSGDETPWSIGAVVIGNTMYRCGEGPWGDENPWGAPVFVLTHTPREPELRQGEIAFRFVTDGIESALEQAKTTAAGRDVLIGGGANVVQQYLNAGFLDEIQISLVPTFLRSGTRLFDQIADGIDVVSTRVVKTPAVTHLTFAINK